MKHKISLQTKLLGLFILSLLAMFALTSVMHFREMSLANEDSDRALRQANTIALDGVLRNQQVVLDKVLTNTLNTDELNRFINDRTDKDALFVVRGILLSLASVKGVRLTIYDKDYSILMQEHVEGLEKRDSLPEAYQPLFLKSAEDFSNIYYFMLPEGENTKAIEYCGATVLTDDDDNPAGFIEITLAVTSWALPLESLTESFIALSSSSNTAFFFSTDKELHKGLSLANRNKPLQDGTVISKTGDKYYLSDRLPIKDPAGKILQYLWLTKDYTSQKNAQRKISVMNISGLILLLTLTIFLTVFFLRRGIIKPIHAIALNLADGGVRIDRLSSQVASGSQVLSEGASEQAAAIEQTSASLEEMSSMAGRNAENAGRGQSIINESRKLIANGNLSMTELSTAMGDISQSSEQIIKIVNAIDDIAFQTNLLALNAAVEAARAGEAGAGFAVVADEVRSLAQKAAAAARETSELIETTVGKVNTGNELVTTTSSIFGSIVESFEKISTLIDQIVVASDEQAQGVQQLNLAVTEMDKVTQQNTSSAEESATVSTELSEHAHAMEQEILSLKTVVGGGKRVT